MAYVELNDGTRYEGIAIGAEDEVGASIAVDSCMSGFAEKTCEKKYKDKILVFTYPIVCGYGVTKAQMENAKPVVRGVIVHESCATPSHETCEANFADYLKKHGITAIEGVDTRAIAKKFSSGQAKSARIAKK